VVVALTELNWRCSFGTGVINLRQFSSWWKREHSNENPGALITDKEWEEIRRLWIQFEIDSGGVDVGAFHKLTKQLKKDGLLNAVVAADAAEAEEAKKQHVRGGGRTSSAAAGCFSTARSLRLCCLSMCPAASTLTAAATTASSFCTLLLMRLADV
jgi:hypothetical protein